VCISVNKSNRAVKNPSISHAHALHVAILSRVWWLLVTKMTGSSSDDWIYLPLGYKFSLNYNEACLPLGYLAINVLLLSAIVCYEGYVYKPVV
jgi:hypothetical protein